MKHVPLAGRMTGIFKVFFTFYFIFITTKVRGGGNNTPTLCAISNFVIIVSALNRRPVIFNVRSTTMYEADYVVSTLPPDMMAADRPHRRSQLSDVISTMPSTSSTAANKKRKLAAVVEEPEPASNVMNEVRAFPSASKSNQEKSNCISVPRVSLVDIIKCNDEQRQLVPANGENSSKTDSEPQVDEQAPVDPEEYFADDINNECLNMICDQAEEFSRTQNERINQVFTLCYSYSPSSALSFDSGEILCNASDIGID